MDAVAVGDRFFKPGCGTVIWIVQRIFVPKADGIPHVALTRDDDTPDRSVISMAALLEGHTFVPDRRHLTPVDPVNLRRRKTDWYPRNLWRRLAG